MTESDDLQHDMNMASLMPLDMEQIHYLFFYIRHVNQFMAPGTGIDTESDKPLVWDWEDLAFYVNTNCPASVDFPATAYHQVLNQYYHGRPATPDTEWRHKYSHLIQVFPDKWITFMNYGYYDFETGNRGLELDGVDADWRYSVQLYHRLANAVNMEGKDILEVGCGRGGGASFITRYLEPRSYVGTDGTQSNILFCREAHDVSNLAFRWSRAEQLAAHDSSVDVVINLESCNYYEPFSLFVEECGRVLRPGGYLLFSTYDHPKRMLHFRQECERGGFEVIEEEDISINVIKALEAFDNGIDIFNRRETVRRKSMYYQTWKVIYEVDQLRSEHHRYYRFALRKT